MTSTEEAQHIRHLDSIKTRYMRGDMLYSREVIGLLLKEIEILSDRLVARTALPVRGAHPTNVTGVCEEPARKGTGYGTCEAPLLNGYCPKWRDHVEED